MFARLFKKPEPDGSDARALGREAKRYAGLLSAKLEQLDVCYRYRKSERDFIERGVQRVRFNLAVTKSDALWLRIDTSPKRFPRGVSLASIDNFTILNDLAVACERPVKFQKTGDGAWLVVELDAGVFGIRQISFNAVDEHYPTKSLKQLNVPLGLTYNNRIVYRSLAEFPHALVGGATGAGKTTFLHGWICSLVQHNKPADMRLGLIDLKGGAEFTRYQKLPHLLEGAFIKDEDQVTWLLANLEGEMRRRLELFEARGGVQNINQWNVRASTSPRYEHLPRIVLFVDELSAIMLRPNLRKDAIRLFTTLGERGRAPGIHLVLATQRPIVRVVDGQIKGNLEARFAFRVTDDTSSMVILDSIDAARMPESTPRGRYIYRSGLDRLELQAPLITPYQIKEIIQAVESGDEQGAAEAAAIAPEEIFRASLSLGGLFSIKGLYKALEGRVSQHYIERLSREYENEVIELDGITYQLLPPEGDFKPRRLIPTAKLEIGYVSPDTGKTDSVSEGAPEDIAQPIAQTAIVPATVPTREPECELDHEAMLAWCEWALNNSRGQLSTRKIYEKFKRPGMTYNDVVAHVAGYEGTRVTVNGKLYEVKPGRGNLPRRIVKVEEKQHGE